MSAILAPLGITVVGLDSLPVVPPPPAEDGETFEANARLKARAYARASGHWCLADDSGLAVDALGGQPGVLSARYAGVDGNRNDCDLANNRKLLVALNEVPDAERTARFVCAMCLSAPDGSIIGETRGTCEGIIARSPCGTGGFGYDPLLYLPNLGRTLAELNPAEKNALSHRGASARAMAELIRATLGDHERTSV